MRGKLRVRRMFVWITLYSAGDVNSAVRDVYNLLYSPPWFNSNVRRLLVLKEYYF